MAEKMSGGCLAYQRDGLRERFRVAAKMRAAGETVADIGADPLVWHGLAAIPAPALDGRQFDIQAAVARRRIWRGT